MINYKKYITNIFDELLNTKCMSIKDMKQKLSSMGREERTKALNGRLTPLEWDEYNVWLETYYSSERINEKLQWIKERGKEDKIPRFLKMVEEINQEIDDELFKYDRRILEDYNVPQLPVPYVDESKYKMDEDIIEINDSDSTKREPYLIGDTEKEMLELQESTMDFTRNQRNCLGGYFTDEYRYIKARLTHDNNYLEDLSEEDKSYYEAEFPRWVRGIDKSINNSNGLVHDTVVYHAGLPDVTLVPGMHGVYKSYTSTAFQKQTCVRHRASHYGDDGWITKILAPKGTKGICANDKRFEGYSYWDEHEYLLGRNTGYTVLSMDYDTREMVVVLD